MKIILYRFKKTRKFTNLLVVLVLSLWHFAFCGRSYCAEASLPMGIQTQEMYANTLLPESGYFPTQAEDPLLKGPSNSRSSRDQGGQWGMAMGPDMKMQSATGLFPYKDQEGNVYQRNPNLFRNMDHLLGFFTPNDAWTVESNEVRHTALTLDANSSILTRTFSPGLAMVKAGPLYFDLLWVGAGAIWSDFNGVQNFAPGQGDGVTSYVGAGFRGLVRVTDTIYLSAAGSLYYLPQINRLAFGLGYGNQNSFAVDLYFSDTWGDWDVSFTNSFAGRPGLNFYSNTGQTAVDRAGQYWFGVQQNQANQFNQNSSAYFNNTIALNASRLVLGRAWRFWSTAKHVDFWRTFDFTNHSQREQLSLVLGYEGSILPFAPRFSYNAYTMNKFRSIYHQIGMDLNGRITENINWNGYLGYLFNSGSGTKQNTFLWKFGLSQNISSKTNHNITIGESFFVNDYSNDALTARYAQYAINHSFTRQLRAGLFAQISDRQSYVSTSTNSTIPSASSAGGGATLTYQPLDFTSITASIIHSESLKPANIYDQWITRLGVTQQLSMRMTGTLMYQYQENNGLQNHFTEHMIMVGLRRYF